MQSPGEKLFRKWIASTDSWVIHTKVDGKSSHEGIRRNFGTLHSGRYVYFYLLVSFNQQRF